MTGCDGVTRTVRTCCKTSVRKQRAIDMRSVRATVRRLSKAFTQPVGHVEVLSSALRGSRMRKNDMYAVRHIDKNRRYN